MADDNISLPTCVLQVDLSCCGDCPTKLKEKLQKINGVYYINIEIEKGLVLVSGTVDPSVIKKKLGKKAKVLAYEKDSIQAKHKLHELFRKHKKDVCKSAHDCFDSHDEDEEEEEGVCVKRMPRFDEEMPNPENAIPRGYQMPRVYGNYTRRPYAYPNHYPSYRRPYLPPPSQVPLSNVMAIYSGQTEAPVGNSIFHSFSDDNVRACIVM